MAAKLTKEHVESFIRACSTGSPSHEAIQRDLSAYVSPLYVQERGGVKSNYLETVDHLAEVRDDTESLDVQIHHLVVDAKERSMASRHTATVRRKGDHVFVKVEVALFGEFNDEGRFVRMYEMAKKIM
jgi:hypothetical protein